MWSFKSRAMHAAIPVCLVLSLPALIFSQAPPALSFEVASIKPSQEITQALGKAVLASGKLHVGMSVDAARVDIGFMSLSDLIPIAFGVKAYQVSGPEWMKAQRFDILAKMPDGATKEQVPEMLQALLQERFKLKVHRENRDFPVYGLVVGKGGSKLKETPPETDTPASDASQGGVTFGDNPVRINAVRGGATIFSGANRTTKISPGPDGQMRLEMSKMSMAAFAEMLTRLVDRPVIDMTELKGNYQIVLDLSMGTLMNVARTAALGFRHLGHAVNQAGRLTRPIRLVARFLPQCNNSGSNWIREKLLSNLSWSINWKKCRLKIR